MAKKEDKPFQSWLLPGGGDYIPPHKRGRAIIVGRGQIVESLHKQQESPTRPTEEQTPPMKPITTTDTVGDAPLPAPLHVIQSAMPERPITKTKRKLSTQTWSLSERASTFDAQVNAQSPADGGPDSSEEDKPIFVDEQVRKQLEAYLGSWLIHAADKPAKDPIAEWSKTPDFQQRDVDTITGELLKPTSQPETNPQPNATDDYGQDMTFKQRTLTANIHINLAREHLEAKKGELALPLGQSLAAAGGLPAVSEQDWPKADCALRPVARADFAEIAAIANLEIQNPNSTQIIESHEVAVQGIERIFQGCERTFRPFIVATTTENELLDRSKWPAGADKAYLEYVKFRQSQPAEPPKILGFAFVAEPRVGFFNAPCPGARHSGHVRVVVHPEHRRNKYGSALLDRILLCLSPYHRSQIDYEWECPDNTHIYEKPATYNRRQYNRIYLETLTGAKEKEPEWRSKMLDKFEFKRVAHFSNMLRTDRGDESEWLGLSVWEVEAMSESTIHKRAPGTWLQRH